MKDLMFAKDDMLPVIPEPSVDNDFNFMHVDRADKSPVVELPLIFRYYNAKQEDKSERLQTILLFLLIFKLFKFFK